MRKIHFFLFLAPLILTFSGCRLSPDHSSDKITSINIIDRNGLTETISSKDRLEAYQKKDFLTPQPYQKVLRNYGRDAKGNILSLITSYHPNGQIKQYLEALNNRAQGAYKEWYPHGQLKVEATLVGGSADINNQAEESWLFDGVSKAWDEEGTLIAEIHYNKGELEGEAKYFHSNGKLWKKIPYRKNYEEGYLEIYLEDGSLLSKTLYKQGMKEGESLRYWKNGEIAANEHYVKGLLWQGSYFDINQQLISSIEEGAGYRALFGKNILQELHQYKKGVQEGEVKIFDEKGALVRLYHILQSEKNGEEYTYFPSSKQPKLLLTWNNGVLEGEVKTWYENGNLESLREMSQNKKNGLFTAWYKNGSLMLAEEYDNDKLIKGEYYPLHQTTPISRIEHGSGIAVLYTPEGSLLKKVRYSDGKPLE